MPRPFQCPVPSFDMSHALGVVAVSPRVGYARRTRCASRAKRSHVTFTVKASSDDASGIYVRSDDDTSPSAVDAEQLLLSRLRQVSGRGAGASKSDQTAIANAVTALEQNGGLRDPALQPEIEGTWRLLYTSKSNFDLKNPLGSRVDGSKPGLEGLFASLFGDENAKQMTEGAESIPQAASSSPIQRTVTSFEAFTIQQALRLTSSSDPRVDQVVQFGDGNYLRLSAKASVDTVNPTRIDFTFDLAYFEFASGPFGIKLPGTQSVRVPYPVPFQLLRDEAKGWLDTTYLGKDVRISKGNKGTTFILVRDTSESGGGALPYEF